MLKLFAIPLAIASLASIDTVASASSEDPCRLTHACDPAPVDGFEVIADYAPAACATVGALGRSGVPLDDAFVLTQIQRFTDGWAGTPELDSLAMFFGGVIIGCIAAFTSGF